MEKKFFKVEHSGTIINIDAISAVTVTRRSAFSCEYRGEVPYTFDQLEKMGFMVGEQETFVACQTWDEARKAVFKDQRNRMISHGCVGYVERKSGKKGLIREYHDDSWENCRVDDHYFLAKELYDEPFLYRVHLGVPSGGVNNDHMTVTLTVEEYASLEKILLAS